MPLPRPITAGDEYLAAIHDVLGEIRDRLPEPVKGKPGQAAVSEPGKPAAKRAAKTKEAR